LSQRPRVHEIESRGPFRVIRYRSLVAGPDAKSAVARKLT
jgi:hypothetical protein